MIRAVIFDWGGVISPGGTPDELPVKLANSLQTDVSTVLTKIALFLSDLKRGKVSEQEFWRMIEAQFQVKLSKKDRDVWTPIELFKPDDQMLTLNRYLKQQGLKTAILSNTFPPSARAIKKAGWYGSFEVVCLSTDCGFAKPDLEFYKNCLDRLGIDGSEAIFVDDQQYCLDAARIVGMKTVLANSPDQITKDVKRLLG